LKKSVNEQPNLYEMTPGNAAGKRKGRATQRGPRSRALRSC
jgi:hypothetical protein